MGCGDMGTEIATSCQEPCDSGDSGRVVLDVDTAPSPLAEQWPYLRFLGLGVWWAWIWLCYFSTRLLGDFPVEMRPGLVMTMYLASTLAIAATMLVAGVFRRSFTCLIDSRWPVIAAGGLAAFATAALAFAGGLGGIPAFLVAAVVTGAGTGALCLKVGRLYGTVGLSDSLTAGAVSLVFASLLYFVGLGLPQSWAVAYVAALPLLSSLLLCMASDDPYGPAAGETQLSSSSSREAVVLYVRLVVAAAVVAFTAGVGRGIASSSQAVEGYSMEGSIIVGVIGLIGVVLAWLVNHMAAQRKGARVAYAVLMIGGIALILGTCFGVPISYLSIGKETLWLVFSCLMAFMAFRFGFVSVRAFAFGQAAYFLASTAGWLVGAMVAPSYDDPTMRMAVGAVLAFAVVVVFTLVFREGDIAAILLAPVPAAPSVLLRGTWGAAVMEGEASATVAGACSSENGAIGVSAAGDTALSATDALEVRCATLERCYGLSRREIEIMDLFAQGRSANWIADTLVISKNTVRSHLRAVYTKLDVHTRQELLDVLDDSFEE